MNRLTKRADGGVNPPAEYQKLSDYEDTGLTPEICAAIVNARPEEEWHEDDGCVLWWRFPIEEPPYIGSPLCCDWTGDYTHWTPLIGPNDGDDDRYEEYLKWLHRRVTR